MALKKSEIEKIIECFGDQLKKIRKSKGLTQCELASLSDMSQRVIAHYETVAKNPPADRLIALASSLNISIDALLGIEDIEFDDTEISFKALKNARLVEKLPADAQNDIYKHISDLAKEHGVH
jgi:transcriptional regulator with XRE-family HTH domain